MRHTFTVFLFQITFFFKKKVMTSSFNNPFQKVREGAKDLFEKKEDSQSSGSALFCHLPPSAPTPIDPYSHTASSTAGFAQSGAYPTLASYNRPQPVQVLEKFDI